jgi:hypothetical protein
MHNFSRIMENVDWKSWFWVKLGERIHNLPSAIREENIFVPLIFHIRLKSWFLVKLWEKIHNLPSANKEEFFLFHYYYYLFSNCPEYERKGKNWFHFPSVSFWKGNWRETYCCLFSPNFGCSRVRRGNIVLRGEVENMQINV